jgi:hypothetical protein
VFDRRVEVDGVFGVKLKFLAVNLDAQRSFQRRFSPIEYRCKPEEIASGISSTVAQ